MFEPRGRSLVGQGIQAFHIFAISFSTERAVRWSILGETLEDPSTASKLSRVDSLSLHLRQSAQKFGVSVSEADIRICPLSDANCSANSIGASGDYFLVRVRRDVELPFFLDNIEHEIRVLGRSEPGV